MPITFGSIHCSTDHDDIAVKSNRDQGGYVCMYVCIYICKCNKIQYLQNAFTVATGLWT